MTLQDISEEEIENYTKVFLSFCDYFDKTFYDSSSNNHNPFWNTANFLFLLNLPSQIKQFSTVRLHWEGVGRLNCEENYFWYFYDNIKYFTVRTYLHT